MASRYKGYMGRILDVDLSTGNIGEYSLTDEERELFLGGRFISTKILWDELRPGIDPLSAENILVVMTSPLTGTGAPSSSRFDISAKSPLTGGIGHSNSGGNFGIHLKRAGWDGLIIRGQAREAVYLTIENGEVQIKKAEDLWGMDTQRTQEALGKGGKIVIGPAGENLVRFATIVSQERSHGRTGMGAVMGSKKLKAVVARGNQRPDIFAPSAFKTTVKKWVKLLKSHPATGDFAPRLGTAGFLSLLSKVNALPTRNFSQGSFDQAERISGERLAKEYLLRNTGCVSCPIRCGRVVSFKGREIKGPEYEVLCLLGSNLELADMEAIIGWNYKLDLLGMDTISTGNVLGFAAELNERGLWDNGIRFGVKDNIDQLLDDMAHCRGVGAELSQGVRYLFKKYGGEDFAAQVKGLELAAYEPRAAVGHGLGYATANRGACHLDGGYVVYFEASGPMTMDPFDYRAKPAWAILDQNLLAAISAAGNCLFTSWTFVPSIAFRLQEHKIISKLVSRFLTWSWPLLDGLLLLPPRLLGFHLPVLPHTRALSQVTGMKMSFGRLFEIGARGYTLERMFNLREGIGSDQDSLSKRFTQEQLVPGEKRSIVPLAKMLPKYYRLRGWDEQGRPSRKLLNRLGLASL